MNGLLITEAFPPVIGGVETFLESICVHSKNKIEVLTQNSAGAEDFDRNTPLTIYRINLKPHLGFMQYLFAGIRLCLKNHYEFLFVGTFSPALYAGVWLKKIFHLPLTLLYHGFDLERQLQFNAFRAIKNLQYCDLLITNSRFNLDRYSNLFSSIQTSVLNPGVDTDIFRPENNSGLSSGFADAYLNGNQVILSVGRLVEKKNHEAVLRCLTKVTKEFPDLKYLIAGDGPKLMCLRGMRDSFGLGKNVSFLGPVRGRELVRLYNACNLFVLPSKERKIDDKGRIDAETFGIVFLEAGACGKPVIGGNSGGVPEAVLHGETGYLVDPDNIEELAGRIIELLTDRRKARSMGEAGRRRVRQNMDWRMVTKRFDKMVEEAVQKRQR